MACAASSAPVGDSICPTPALDTGHEDQELHDTENSKCRVTEALR